MNVSVEGAIFSFPASWHALKYDDSEFYRQVFSRIHNGLGAVDVVALEPAGEDGPDARVVLIEVKDYRHPNLEAKKPSELVEAVLKKTTGTMAGLSVAVRRATDENERSVAQRSHVAARVEVVLHCENPSVPIVDPSELAIKLAQRLRPIVDSVAVGDSRRPRGPWTVTMPVLED